MPCEGSPVSADRTSACAGCKRRADGKKAGQTAALGKLDLASAKNGDRIPLNNTDDRGAAFISTIRQRFRMTVRMEKERPPKGCL